MTLDPTMPSFTPRPDLRSLYPPIEPHETGLLKVDETHSIFWEVSGNPNGVPVVFLHGGPGAGSFPADRQFFDPQHYRIVLFDQRGAARSTPLGCLENNTTWELVGDVEKLRQHLNVERWHVFGGSWGSFFSLLYAQCHPQRVLSIAVRGVCAMRRRELDFVFQEGASEQFPDLFDAYQSFIPEEERGDLTSAYHRRLTGADESVRIEAARHWCSWELAISSLYPSQAILDKVNSDTAWTLAFARIEAHYFVNGSFIRDNQVLEKAEIDKIRHIPTVIVQGRYDAVCPVRSAYELHRQFPEAELYIIPDAGHGSREPGTAHQSVLAMDRFRSIRA